MCLGTGALCPGSGTYPRFPNLTRINRPEYEGRAGNGDGANLEKPALVLLFSLSFLTPLTETEANRSIPFRFNAWSVIQVITYYYNDCSFSFCGLDLRGQKTRKAGKNGGSRGHDRPTPYPQVDHSSSCGGPYTHLAI